MYTSIFFAARGCILLLIFAHNICMIILYVLLIVYILSVNFYAFLLVKSLKDKEKAEEIRRLEEQSSFPLLNVQNTTSAKPIQSPNEKTADKSMSKLFITGLLGGAITIYVCMFIYKYKRSELLLMVLMPLLGILNIYFWILMFKSGFGFFIIR